MDYEVGVTYFVYAGEDPKRLEILDNYLNNYKKPNLEINFSHLTTSGKLDIRGSRMSIEKLISDIIGNKELKNIQLDMKDLIKK